jgi:type IV pilus assembly protein PilX
MSSNSPILRRKQSGMALVTAILLLVVMTIMAISMMRSYGVEEKIAGNTREKERALNAAVSAQQYAEYWLSANPAPLAGACTGIVSSTIGQICTPPLPTIPLNFSTLPLPWASGVTYTQFTSNPIAGVTNTIAGVGAGAQGTYYAAPVFYITDLGPNKGTPVGELYQIDAVGYGGTPNAVAVVESTYVMTSNTAHSLDP